MTAMAAPGSTVLRMVGNRMSVLNIEVETGWHPDRIRELAEEEGYSFDATTGRFFRASHIAAGTGEAGDSTVANGAEQPAVPAVPIVTEAAAVQESPPPPAPEPPAPPVTAVVEVEAPVSPPTSTTVADPAGLIAAGLGHDDERVAKLAEHAVATLNNLARSLVEWEQRGAARAEVARLEAELADARRRAGIGEPPSHRAPRPKPQPVAGRATPAEIRAWAAANGVECTRVGIVPRRVVEAYLDAQEAVAS